MTLWTGFVAAIGEGWVVRDPQVRLSAPEPQQTIYKCVRSDSIIDDDQLRLDPAQVIGNAVQGGVLVHERGSGQLAEQARLPGSRQAGKDQVTWFGSRGHVFVPRGERQQRPRVFGEAGRHRRQRDWGRRQPEHVAAPRSTAPSPCCTASTASRAEANTAAIPSPMVENTTPPCDSTAPRTIAS
jgi:hypothetical protein